MWKELTQTCGSLIILNETAFELTPEEEEKILKNHAPIVRFHKDEKHFPSSLDWYFQRTKLVDANDPTKVMLESINDISEIVGSCLQLIE
jgi:hypothetical protein